MSVTARPPLEVVSRVEHGVFRMVLRGVLDDTTAPAVARTLERAAETQADTITLDLRSVTFLDATGMRCLTDAYELSRQTGQQLLTIKGRVQLQRLLDMNADPLI